MRSLTLVIIATLALVSCEAPRPASVTSPPGSYTVTKYDADGRAIRSYQTERYTHSHFPPSVSFNSGGRLITLTGSWEVRKTP